MKSESEKLIESLCLYCQGDFSDRMVTSFFVTNEDPNIRKVSEDQRFHFVGKAEDLHIRTIFKNSLAKPVPVNAKKGTRVMTMIGQGELQGIELGGKRFLVNLDNEFPIRPAAFFKNEIKLL